jgi:fatty acid desaturase
MRNAPIVATLVGLNVWQFLIVPLLPPAWAWTLLPLALTSNTLWSAIHEAVHGNLFRSPALNVSAGRILSCVFGSSFSFLSAGHLTHHALNRTDEQLEVLKPGESIWRARAKYYFYLCGGLYLSELLVPLAFIAPWFKLKGDVLKDPFVASIYFRAVIKRRAIVLESVVAVTFLSVSAWLYGERWEFFAGILLARALFISALDYIYHYGNPVGDVNAAANLYLPRPLARLLLNFNLHQAHHISPRTPWHNLPAYYGERGIYADSFFRAALRVWKGPR